MAPRSDEADAPNMSIGEWLDRPTIRAQWNALALCKSIRIVGGLLRYVRLPIADGAQSA